MNKVIWRYMDLWKLRSLLERGAIWMNRLGALQDQFEGTLPARTREAIVARDKKLAEMFPDDDRRQQLVNAARRNVDDGRDMLVVNCWNDEPQESSRMWSEYVQQAPGIAIRSTVRSLMSSILIPQEFMQFGRVRYIDFTTHDMGTYEGHQAWSRALLKSREFSHESEVRLVSMNLVCPGTLNQDGSPPSAHQLSGPGMFDPARGGIFLRVNPQELIHAVVLQPGAPTEFSDLIKSLCGTHSLRCEPSCSSLPVDEGRPPDAK